MAGTSLFENYGRTLAAAVGCGDLRHKSARFPPGLRDGRDLIRHLYDDLKQSLDAAIAGPDYRPSAENFRWLKPQLAISEKNDSPEVTFERAVIQACRRLGRGDWANQVPLVSGIAGPRAYKRRAIDLVRKVSDSEFNFIELKIASDTPLYAAAEILLYGLIWLHTRGRSVESSGSRSPLLDASSVELSVLAPPAFYGRSDIRGMSEYFSCGLAALAQRHGVKMSLAFTAFPNTFNWPAALTDDELVWHLDNRQPV